MPFDWKQYLELARELVRLSESSDAGQNEAILRSVVSRAYFGDHPAFVVPGYTLLSEWELLVYLLLGIACGLGGVAFLARRSREA